MTSAASQMTVTSPESTTTFAETHISSSAAGSTQADVSTSPSAGGASSNAIPAYPYLAAPLPTGSVPYGFAGASLYVGDLPFDVNESMLFELFSQVGPVSSIRVCRDIITRRSLGYAYVNFHNPLDAERAIDTLNYTPIKGVPCRIMWSQRDPSLRRSGDGNIFIKNLDKSIDAKVLHDTLSAFGPILSCKIARDNNGESKGYGFVHFETAEAATKAVQKVNGMLLNDKKVFVGHHISRKERQSKLEEQKATFTNVFVKNLPDDMDDEKLNEVFGKYGVITSAVVMRDTNGKSCCFGFINYEKHDEAQAAVDALSNTEMNGKTLYVGRAQKKAERAEELRRRYEQARLEKLSKYQGVNLYVKNLHESIDDDKLREAFASFGPIASAKVMRDEKGISKGFGFVCFTTVDDASKALNEMNGAMLDNKPLFVAQAQRRDVRRAQLEAQFAQRAQARIPGTGIGGPMYPGGPMFYPGALGAPQRATGYVFSPPSQMMARPRYVPQPSHQNMGGVGVGGAPGGGKPFVGGATQQPPAVNGIGQGPVRPIRPRQPSRMPNQSASRFNTPATQYFLGGAGQRRGPKLGGNGGGSSTFNSANRGGMNAIHSGGNPSSLTAASLAAAAPEQQKQILGERIFPVVHAREPELAGKITGMLLEMDNSELLHLLESPEAMSSKISEAVTALRQHLMQQQQQQSQPQQEQPQKQQAKSNGADEEAS